MKTNKEKSITGRVSVRLTDSDKQKLETLARKKGCDGLTSLLRLLAKAKDVVIKI